MSIIKESEIYHRTRCKNGHLHYGCRFHFKGSIVNGKGGRILFGRGGSTFDKVPVTVRFGTAFIKVRAITYIDEREGAACTNQPACWQIDFITDSEWAAEKEIEGESQKTTHTSDVKYLLCVVTTVYKA